tara:strand:+ start:1117 stop:4677 length:3561 start_codon:yes stop_codon:yes gene_type:complete
MAEAPENPIQIDPVVFDRAYLDQFAEEYRDVSGGPLAFLARTLSEEFQSEYPDYISYQGLKSGTAPMFEFDPFFKQMPADKRALTDEDIVQLFSVDPQGRPIEKGTFSQGFFRRILPETAGARAALAGARAAGRLAPQGKDPRSMLLKGGAMGAGGLYGYLFGSELADVAQTAVIGEEAPLLPEHRAAYEAGKTGAAVGGALLMPFAMSPNAAIGASQYLKNIAALRSSVAEAGGGGARIMDETVARQLAARDPISLRLLGGAERLLGETAKVARERPLTFAAGELTAGAGMVGGAYSMEKAFPGEPLPRIAGEMVGGVGAGILAQPVIGLVTNAPEIASILRSSVRGIKERGVEGFTAPVKTARQETAINRIVDLLEAEGEDVEAIIQTLASREMTNLLTDDAGRPISLTAGMKTGSPTLLAIESSLDQLGSQLSKERGAAATQSVRAIKNAIYALAATGDKAAIQRAAGLVEDAFQADIASRLTAQTDNVLQAFRNVQGDAPESNMALSEKLYDVVTAQLEQARRKESQLWKDVPSVTVYRAEEGEVPSFIQTWRDTKPKTPEAFKEHAGFLGAIDQFVARKASEFGVDVDPEVVAKQREAAAAAGKEFEEIVPDGVLTSKELVEMRSAALSAGRKAEAAGDLDGARMAFKFARSLYDELDAGLAKADNAAYNMARSYSRALNDVFTRSFANSTRQTQRTGAPQVEPELFAKRLLQGGNDPAYLRMRQISDIGKFIQEQGLEQFAQAGELAGEEAVAGIQGTLLALQRNARAASFNPETGEIDPRKLRAFVRDNEELMGMFPRLRDDLLDAEKANVLLNEERLAIKAQDDEMRARVTWRNMLSEETEDPVTAIGEALARGNYKPMLSLNRLAQVAESAPENLRDAAKSGLKSSILEYAIEKAGGSSKTFNAQNFYQTLFRKVPRADSDISLTEWMKGKGIMNEEEVDTLRRMIGEMAKFEVALATGGQDFLDVVERAGPVLDFYLSVAGSAVGTRAYNMMGGTGPGALAAAGRGAQIFRQIFEQVPESMRTDVMSELMRDPELLATLMRRPKSEREKLRIADRIGVALRQMGIAPVRRELPSTGREIREEFEALDRPALTPELMPPLEERRTQDFQQTPAGPIRRAQAPRPVAQAAPPPMPAPAPAAPQPAARQQYAALFPFESTSQMIRASSPASGGIGSLMG